MAAEAAHPSGLVHGDGDSLCTNPIGSTIAPAVAENERQNLQQIGHFALPRAPHARRREQQGDAHLLH